MIGMGNAMTRTPLIAVHVPRKGIETYKDLNMIRFRDGSRARARAVKSKQCPLVINQIHAMIDLSQDTFVYKYFFPKIMILRIFQTEIFSTFLDRQCKDFTSIFICIYMPSQALKSCKDILRISRSFFPRTSSRISFNPADPILFVQ